MQITTLETTRVAAVGEANKPAVTLHGLTKRYGPHTVLDGIDLSIAPGEFVALVGRSGCGKSTLLRLIAGLEQADGGTVAIDGAGRADALRLMFQEARLLPWKSVLENVALGGIRQGAALAALEQVGLATRAGEWPSVLSGGQRQRVALARALVHAPGILLLDEPLGALDALTRIGMQQLIESLWQRQGFSAVLVTHDVQEALVLADRVLVIEEGRIAQDIRVDLARPRQRGSAGFAALERALLARVLGTQAA
jgi:sulfonate transport system ATP-binding protein